MNYAAITLASLASSLHCAAMCGGFAVVVGGLPRAGESARQARGRFVRGQLAWALGRTVGYMTLGALAGGLGAGITTLGDAMGWKSVTHGGFAWSLPDLASTLAGAALVVLALRELWPRRDGSTSRRSVSSRTTLGGAITHRDEATAGSSRVVPLRLPAVSGATRSTTTTPGTTRPRLASRLARGAADGSSFAAFALGLSAATLLCGLSWSFVVLASASAGPLDGALVMLAFALGTVPATLSVAGLAQGPLQRVLRWMERRWSPQVAAQVGPKLAAITLLVLGLVTLSGRVSRVPSEVHVASDGRLVGAHVDDTCHPPEPLP